MSVNFLHIIPVEPDFVPGSLARATALGLFKTYLEAADIREIITPTIEFIDQGGNFEQIRCPRCDHAIPIDWWQEAMDRRYNPEHGFVELAVATPCCYASVSLNDLRYHWPAGFAKYRLEARDPHGDITLSQQQALEAHLHCALRKIWARY